MTLPLGALVLPCARDRISLSSRMNLSIRVITNFKKKQLQVALLLHLCETKEQRPRLHDVFPQRPSFYDRLKTPFTKQISCCTCILDHGHIFPATPCYLHDLPISVHGSVPSALHLFAWNCEQRLRSLRFSFPSRLTYYLVGPSKSLGLFHVGRIILFTVCRQPPSLQFSSQE